MPAFSCCDYRTKWGPVTWRVGSIFTSAPENISVFWKFGHISSPCNALDCEKLWQILSLNHLVNFRISLRLNWKRMGFAGKQGCIKWAKEGQQSEWWGWKLGDCQGLGSTTDSGPWYRVSCGHVQCWQSTWDLAEGTLCTLSFVSNPQVNPLALDPPWHHSSYSLWLHFISCLLKCVCVCVCVCRLPETQNSSLGPNHGAAKPLLKSPLEVCGSLGSEQLPLSHDGPWGPKSLHRPSGERERELSFSFPWYKRRFFFF